jgi:hypothetical protein
LRILNRYRAKVILLKDDGYTVPEIRWMVTNHHDVNIRKWFTVSMKKVMMEYHRKYTNINQSR